MIGRRALSAVGTVAVVVAALFVGDATAQQAVDASTIKGKYLYGYQGWFRRPGEGNGNTHWSSDGKTPGPGDVVFDFYPDTSEYPADCLFDTGFTLPDGSAAKLYTATCDGVVDKHFEWMQQFGIDGIMVQRFYTDIPTPDFVTLLETIRQKAEKYGRVFAIEYDLSGADSTTSDITSTILTDFQSLSNITTSPSYLHESNKPVVELWGLGIRSTITVADGQKLTTTMKDSAHVILGIRNDWRVSTDPYTPVYELADIINPWTVGSYSNASYPSFFTDRQKGDLEMTQSLGIGYAPVVWPGGGDANLQDGTAYDFNPRFNGSFYTVQAQSVLSLDPPPLFVFSAMFDEVNEGTASYGLLKVDELPTNQRFVGIDNDMDHTFYLQLGGQFAAKLHEAHGL